LCYNLRMREESCSGKYVYVIVPGHPMADSRGRVLKHRFVMAKHLDRPLSRNEHVHHINENRKDNRISNLELMSPEEHNRRHRPCEMLHLICKNCGEPFDRSKRRTRHENTFCSRSCAISYSVPRRKKKPIKHGTVTGYGRGCRCRECKAEHAASLRAYRRRKRNSER